MNIRWYFVLPALLLAGALGFIGYQKFKPEEIPAVQLTRQDVLATLTVTGEVRSKDRVMVSTPVQDRIESVLVDDGDVVKKGQVLVVLNRDDMEATLAESRARHAQAQASLAFILQGTRQEELQRLSSRVAETEARLKEAEAGLATTQHNYEEAQRNAARMEALHRQEFISETELDASKTKAKALKSDVSRRQAAVTSARSSLSQAQAQLAQGKRGATAPEVSEARAARQAAEAAANSAQAKLSDRVIRSNINGVVAQRLKEPGDLAVPGQAILELADPTKLEILAFVEEGDLSRVSVGDEAHLVLDALPETPLTGTIQRIGSRVNPENGTVEVLVTLVPPKDNEKVPQLLPGMTTDVNIISARLKDVMVVPSTAVRSEGSQRVVYVFDGNQLKETSVQVKKISLEYFQVLGGLSPDLRVAKIADTKLLEKKNVAPKTP
ncbi:MAG: efflux RND transporter periplasmic adaptor subunit [Vampirovibrio sp.]|nr:efflux RND transporter periplasmic adaptor subunit [Vampirovibrio sp.]